MDKIRVTGIHTKPIGNYTKGKEYNLHVWDGDDEPGIIGGIFDDEGIFIQIYVDDSDIEYMIVT